jgi:geranylgeranyl diphosphate synthase type I
LLGDNEKYGVNAAILLGDLALTLAFDELDTACAGAGQTFAEAMRTRKLFSQMCQEVIIGQYLDVLLENEPIASNVTLAHAHTVLLAKSASYSVKYPLLLGAILTGANDSQLKSLAEIGDKLGSAFQLRDDILGVFGDSMLTGKPAGDDLVEGKRTVLLIEALNGCSPVDRVLLEHAIGNRELNPAQLAAAQAAISRSGARLAVETEISSLADAARAELSELDILEPGKAMLLEIADILVTRDA